MAAFGAKYLRFSKIVKEESGKLPTYDQKVVTLGGLVKADLTINYASGEMYADDKLAERVEEFMSGSLAVEVDELEDEEASIVYGAKINESDEKADNSADSAPYGGLGYYKTLTKNKVKFWRGYYYPKVRATLGNDNAATKSSSITLATTPITFTVFEPENGDWRYMKKFSSEVEVKAWLDGKLGNGAETPESGTEG